MTKLRFHVLSFGLYAKTVSHRAFRGLVSPEFNKAIVWFLISNSSFCDASYISFPRYWTWEWQHTLQCRLKWPSNVIQGHRTWYKSKARIRVANLLLVVYSNIRHISLTISEIRGVLMLKTNFCLTNLYLTLIWRLCRRNMEKKFGVRKRESRGFHMVKKSWS